ncbi:Exodeoxyribonuclease VIII (putative partial) from phage origin [Shigella sonnei]|nr:hypothetical protein [Shigella sonnei]EJL16999.1 hypothetical protein SSMOSELEY_2330 [Shigella sonnei str. Moseley]MBX8680943.1 exodeoxyribonuclease VIII [Shigella sonnei]MBX8767981.1 exodeoxyribonuclease VIII [Shigella sonnei]NPC03188.1 exodeoxyribonuclease VIII [Shigella sonnei]QNG00084.1 exodeoxyribonuclease VIII [Shigella sonnei]
MPFYFRKECPLNSGYLNNETGEDELNWKKQVLIAAVYGLCANPACIAYAPAIPDIAMMIANKLENFGVTSDERLPDF